MEKKICYTQSIYYGIAEIENVMFCEWILVNYHINNIIISNDLEYTFIIKLTNLKVHVNLGMLKVTVIFVISLDNIVTISITKYKACDLAWTPCRDQDFNIKGGEVWNILPRRM
jgi:hypothetical protein